MGSADEEKQRKSYEMLLEEALGKVDWLRVRVRLTAAVVC